MREDLGMKSIITVNRQLEVLTCRQSGFLGKGNFSAETGPPDIVVRSFEGGTANIRVHRLHT